MWAQRVATSSRESVVGRPEGAQPPNTAGGNTTRGETVHGKIHPPTKPFLFVV